MQVSSNFRQPSLAVILPFVVCTASFWSLGARAADPVLGAPSTASSPAAESGKTYVVKPGDTLDKVVRNTLADSPLRVDLLKDEIAKLNPQAFTKGSKSTLMAGATLRLPRHEELLLKHLKPAVESSGGATPALANERRQWVRYP